MGRSRREQREAAAAAQREDDLNASPASSGDDLLTLEEAEAELRAVEEDDDLDIPEPEEEIELDTKGEVYVFKSKYDFTRKFGKSGTKREPDGQGGFTAVRSSRPIPVRFVDRTAVITETFAREYGYSARELAEVMRKDSAYLQTFCIYKGPGDIKLTRAEVDFLKRALATIRKYGARVVQGAR